MKSAKTVRLIYVDDDADQAEMLRHHINKWFSRIHIEHHTRPLSQLDLYRNYDAVILDYRLGAMNGLEIAAQIHHFDWRIPVMIMTGWDVRQLDTKRNAIFVCGFASKADDDQLYIAIRRLLMWVGRVREARNDHR